MFRTLVPAAGLIAAFALAAKTESAQPAPPVLEMGWSLTHEGDMAKLAYGVPNSDQLAIMMTCQQGRAVDVYGDVRPDTSRLIQASNEAALIDPMSGRIMEEIRISASDRTLSDLADGEGLKVRGDAGARILPIRESETGLAAQFVAHCQSARA